MAKKTQNLPTDYFTQKNRDKLESVLFAGGVIGLVAFLICYLTFYWYYSMIGLYIGGSCIIAYIVITAKKVKDDGYDTHVNEFIEKNSLMPASKYSLRLFDGERGYVKLGRDRKLRSSVYCISEFEFTRDLIKLSLTEIDFCATADGLPGVTSRKFTLPSNISYRVEDSEITIGEIKRKIQYLILECEDDRDIKLPIDPTSIDTDEIIAKIKGKR